ncbi:MAG TPA: site-2 protease family protein [Candidatus Limnocylindrales bacterium]|nr:site-2 protease family protein [Candidatus Limnocylindrales bacterium]
MDFLVNIAVLLAIIVPLVLAHEVGHFLMARRAGVTVHEFGIGFPPRALVLRRGKETTYSLNWLPIGGFVRLEGEEGESLDPRAFVNQGLATRLRILAAGVIVNFALAWLIFTLIALFAQPLWGIRVNEVMPDSPAQRAGLVASRVVGQTEPIELLDQEGQPTGETRRFPIHDDSGDLIVAIDGRQFPIFDDVAGAASRGARSGPVQYLADRPGQTVVLTVEHADGSREDIEVTLRTAAEVAAGQGALGFLPGAEYGERQNGLIEASAIGLQRTVEASTLILRGVAELIGALLQGPGAELPVAGPLGIADLVGGVRETAPPVVLLWLVGLLSANLAVINALPFPPMDGGRMAMALIQAVSRNRVSPAAERMVYLTGFVMLMTLLVVVTMADIGRLDA